MPSWKTVAGLLLACQHLAILHIITDFSIVSESMFCGPPFTDILSWGKDVAQQLELMNLELGKQVQFLVPAQHPVILGIIT